MALRIVDERLSEYVSGFNKPWMSFPVSRDVHSSDQERLDKTGLPKSSGTPRYSPFLIRLSYQDNAPLSSPTVPRLDEDCFGQQFLREFGEVVGEPWMSSAGGFQIDRVEWHYPER